MKILNFILCEDIIRDAESDRISLINITEQLVSIAYPFLLPKIGIFMFLEKENQEVTVSGEILIKNNDNTLAKNSLILSFSEKDKARVMIKFNGIAIPEPGNLTVDVLLNGETRSSVSIPVFQKTLQEVTEVLKSRGTDFKASSK